MLTYKTNDGQNNNTYEYARSHLNMSANEILILVVAYKYYELSDDVFLE